MNLSFLKRYNFLDIELPDDATIIKSFITYLQSVTGRVMDLTKFCSAALGSTLFAIGAALVAARDKIPPNVLHDVERIFTWAIFGILATVAAAMCGGLSGMYLDTGTFLSSRENPSKLTLERMNKALLHSYRYIMVGIFILLGASFTVLMCILNVISIAFKMR